MVIHTRQGTVNAYLKLTYDTHAIAAEMVAAEVASRIWPILAAHEVRLGW